ncbi:MAG: DUF554 domain-containing protein [Actinomycetia bacterium]|nr:DUF554 domain-containing protein [Actinomycetes bacterium]
MRNIVYLYPSLLNGLTILLGTAAGAAFSRVPPRIRETALQGAGLFVLLLGAQMALHMARPLNALLAMALGAAVGEGLNLEAGISRLAGWAKKRLGGTATAEAFVASAILFDVGALAIVGSIQAGLGQTPVLLLTKSVLDGISAVLLSATLGWGVAASAPLTALYEGSVTVLAGPLVPVFRPTVLQDFDVVGGLIVSAIGIGFIWRPPPLKVVTLLPALPLAVILGWAGAWLHITFL